MLLSQVRCGSHLSPQIPVARQCVEKDFEILGPIQGQPVASLRNHGARLSRGKWLLFTDHDCHLDLQEVSLIINYIQENKLPYVAVGGLYRPDRTLFFWQAAYHRIQKTWVERGLQEDTDGFLIPGVHLLGGALLVRRDVFETIGGFSEAVGWGAEESEWVKRLLCKSYATAVCKHWQVTHKNQLSFFGFLRRAWVQNRNRTQWKVTSHFIKKGPWIYFKSPISQMPWLILFFSVAVFASLWGRVIAFRRPTQEVMLWS